MSKSVAEQVAEEVLRLINRSPRTPTKAQLTDTIAVMLDVVQEEAAPFSVPLGTTVQPQRPGAFLRLEADFSLMVDGWTIGSARPLSPQESALAILEWIKNGVLQSRRQS